MDKTKPNFTASITRAEDNKSNNKTKKEVGAIWKKISTAKNEYLKIKFNKEELKSILDGSEDDTMLVAFVNKNKNGDIKRPDYRIYKDE